MSGEDPNGAGTESKVWLMSFGGPNMPPRYREWIDAYYRRLQARRGRT